MTHDHSHSHSHSHGHPGAATMPETPEFSGFKGRVAAFFLTSPFRKLLEWKMGKPEGRLLELLDLKGGEQVLDAGCGSGFHTLMMAELLPEGHIVATDVSTEMLDRLRAQAERRKLSARISPTLADNLALDMEDNRFDRAISAAVWHHLPDPQQAARELFRTLKPGGKVVVSDVEVVANKKAVAGLDGHDVAFGSEDMRRFLEGAGFAEVSVEKIGTWVIGSGLKPA